MKPNTAQSQSQKIQTLDEEQNELIEKLKSTLKPEQNKMLNRIFELDYLKTKEADEL